jgi:type IV secretion system protein VirB11
MEAQRIETAVGGYERPGLAHAQLIVRQHLKPVLLFLEDANTLEVCINEAGVVWVESRSGWMRHVVPEMSSRMLDGLAQAVASWSSQSWRAEFPIMSSALPGGYRAQFVGPPATESISVTIRKPSAVVYTLGDLDGFGLFSATKRGAQSRLSPTLQVLWKSGSVAEFLEAAVVRKLNILISGATGSGKTSLSRALIGCIPSYERVVTIEDTRELCVPHVNSVSMQYTKGSKKFAARELLESSLRMRPDRILLQELRDGVAFDYLRNVNSGHPGSITTVHADSCAGAFEQLTLLVKQSEAGADLARDDVRKLLTSLVDVVVQCARVDVPGERRAFRVTEIDFVASRRLGSDGNV